MNYLLAYSEGLPIVHTIQTLLGPNVNLQEAEPLLLVTKALFGLVQKPPIGVQEVLPGFLHPCRGNPPRRSSPVHP